MTKKLSVRARGTPHGAGGRVQGNAPSAPVVSTLASRTQARSSGGLMVLWIYSAISIIALLLGGTAAWARYTLLRPPPMIGKTPQPSVVAVPPSPLPTLATLHFLLHGEQGMVRAVAWSDDGTLLASGGDDGSVLIWNADGTRHARVQLEAGIRALAWGPDSRHLAAADGASVTFLDTGSSPVQVQSHQQHRAAVTALAWTQLLPFRLVSTGVDKRAIVWDTTTQVPHLIFSGHTTPILAVATDASTVATASEGGVIRVWDTESGQEIHGYFFDGPISIRSLAFSPTGEVLAAGGDDGRVHLWNGLLCQHMTASAFGQRCLDEPRQLQASSGPVRTVAVSPNGVLLATGGADGQLLIWNVASGTPLVRLDLQEEVFSLAWNADSTAIAVAAGSAVSIWQLQT